MSIVAIVLAMGEPIEDLVDQVQASRCDHVGVVLGAAARDIVPTLAGRRLTLVLNGAWTEGIATSIRAGMQWADRNDAVMICASSQPDLCAAHVDSLIAAHLATGRTVVSRCGGVLGLPAVFGREMFAQLVTLEGTAGPLSVIGSDAVAIDWPEGPATEVA